MALDIALECGLLGLKAQVSRGRSMIFCSILPPCRLPESHVLHRKRDPNLSEILPSKSGLDFFILGSHILGESIILSSIYSTTPACTKGLCTVSKNSSNPQAAKDASASGSKTLPHLPCISPGADRPNSPRGVDGTRLGEMVSCCSLG